MTGKSLSAWLVGLAAMLAADGTLYVGGVTTSRDFPTRNAWQDKYGGDPGFGSVPNGGSTPVGWGNGDCWLAKFRPVPVAGPAVGETTPATDGQNSHASLVGAGPGRGG